jgi:hypothetical protein
MGDTKAVIVRLPPGAWERNTNGWKITHLHAQNLHFGNTVMF